MECVDLKPTPEEVENYPGITRMRMFYSFCAVREVDCQARRLYGKAPVYGDWQVGKVEKVRQRTFDNEFLPRYQTDKMDPPKTTRRANSVGTDTNMMHFDPEVYGAYKGRKDRVHASLQALPKGLKPADIYDPVRAFYRQQEQRKRCK